MVAHIKKDSSAVDFNPFCDLGKTFEQFKMLTQAMQSMQESSKGAQSLGEKGGAADMTRHTETAQKAWQKMLDDMKALAEMVQKAQTDAMAGLTERAKENMSAVQGLAHAK